MFWLLKSNPYASSAAVLGPELNHISSPISKVNTKMAAL